MTYRTLYVSKADETWWERADDLAKRRGTSLSKLVSRQLRSQVMGFSTGVEPETASQLAQRISEDSKRLAKLLSES